MNPRAGSASMSMTAGERGGLARVVQLFPQVAGFSGFRVAPSFVVEALVSLAYVGALGHLWKRVQHLTPAVVAVVSFTTLIMLCYAGKIFIIRYLEKRGGDARTYVESNALVTDGPYAWSRNPGYLLTLIQFSLWSALFLLLQALEPMQPRAMIIALVAPVAFFFISDRVVIAAEERELAVTHRDEFPAYARRVKRWFGRTR